MAHEIKLAASARNNPERGITGLLLFNGRNFLQLLEGEEARGNLRLVFRSSASLEGLRSTYEEAFEAEVLKMLTLAPTPQPRSTQQQAPPAPPEASVATKTTYNLYLDSGRLQIYFEARREASVELTLREVLDYFGIPRCISATESSLRENRPPRDLDCRQLASTVAVHPHEYTILSIQLF